MTSHDESMLEDDGHPARGWDKKMNDDEAARAANVPLRWKVAGVLLPLLLIFAIPTILYFYGYLIVPTGK